VASCELVKVDPFAWFCNVLTRFAAHPITKLEYLLPHRWGKLARNIAFLVPNHLSSGVPGGPTDAAMAAFLRASNGLFITTLGVDRGMERSSITSAQSIHRTGRLVDAAISSTSKDFRDPNSTIDVSAR